MLWRVSRWPSPAVARATSAAASAGTVIQLDGTWRFALDRDGKGIEESWWRRRLEGHATLPGTLAGQGIGDPITLDTPWIGQIVDRSFFTAPEYAPYRQPGQIKVPFWLQPDRHYVGAAWYQTDVTDPGRLEGPPHRAAPRASALADRRRARHDA